MSRSSLSDAESSSLALCLVDVIDTNAAYLSEVDGAIGDGDHGINMKKGFDLFESRVRDKKIASASEGFLLLGDTLMKEIGGSMGPLYGSFFKAMAGTIKGKDIDAAAFLIMLKSGMQAVMDIGQAKPGDKTMLDSLSPAIEAFEASLEHDGSFVEALSVISSAALRGAENTANMVAKVGRASRLGERSRGVRDAGATSCALILDGLAKEAIRLLSY